MMCLDAHCVGNYKIYSILLKFHLLLSISGEIWWWIDVLYCFKSITLAPTSRTKKQNNPSDFCVLLSRIKKY